MPIPQQISALVILEDSRRGDGVSSPPGGLPRRSHRTPPEAWVLVIIAEPELHHEDRRAALPEALALQPDLAPHEADESETVDRTPVTK